MEHYRSFEHFCSRTEQKASKVQRRALNVHQDFFVFTHFHRGLILKPVW